MQTITSANSELILVCSQVFAAPQSIEGYATEDAWNVAQFEVAQVRMGVDAHMSAGFVPAVKEMDLMLQADSPSRQVLQRILGVMEATREVVFIDNATLALPGTGEVWEFTKGVITKAPKTPPGKKVLESTTWQITWEDIQPAGI
jgi:hypothetical protein